MRNTPLLNDLRARRSALGWSQEELARRSGLSRAEISAVETGRLVPSTLAALALADALGCRVDHLFRRAGSAPAAAPSWAWAPPHPSSRWWRAEVGGLDRLYPVEPPASSLWPADGQGDPPSPLPPPGRSPSDTLVLAGCDPAAPLLSAELSRSSPVRLLAFNRSSGAALQLLADGLVHLAGLHLGGESGDGHASLVRERLGPGFGLLRLATWEQGVALSPGLRVSSVGSAVSSGLRWVGREPGSGSRQCLDELLGPRRRPRHLAPDHPSVALAIRSGWADAGICPRLPSEEAGLHFLPLRREAYDLCFPSSLSSDPRFLSLLTTLRSTSFRSLLSSLPGYSPSSTGEMAPIP